MLIGLALLALIANETRYNSVVELRLATNQRDEVRAYFLARSGIGLSRLMLRFQKQVDSIQIPNIGGILSSLGLGGSSPTTPGAAPGAPGLPGGASQQPSSLGIQLWKMAKIDCYMLQQMVPEDEEDPSKSGDSKDRPHAKSRSSSSSSSKKKLDFDEENPELAAKQANRKFGGFEGCFNTEFSDEEEKINLNKLDSPSLSARVALTQLMATLGDKKYEFLFDGEVDAKTHDKVTPQDVIIAMKDWIDEDETASAVDTTGTAPEPFLKGFSDENMNYDKYDPRYKAKNSRFDSLDELYMVRGVNDRFMAAFKDKLTIYPDVNSNININTDDPVLLEVAIRSVTDPLHPDPRLGDPIFVDALIKKIRAARLFSIFRMSAQDFVNVVQAAGLPVNPTLAANMAQNRFISDKTSTFRIKVTGEAGDVQKSITVVIRTDDGLGRLVYWREN
ncbi:MAG: type II secretion system protein GspK [Myxococcaceae bacterium]